MTTITISRATIRERIAATDHCTYVLTRGDKTGQLLPITLGGRTYHRPPCTIDGCDKPTVHLGLGLCEPHRSKYRRYGDPTVVKPRGGARAPSGPGHYLWKDTPGYAAAHYRVRNARGPAAEHPCAGCDQPAAEWSYTGGDPAEITCPKSGNRYSTDPTFYVPRCAPCHREFDAAKRGHRRTRTA